MRQTGERLECEATTAEAGTPRTAMHWLLGLRLPVAVEFHHRVVRAWQQPVETVLSGGLATLPLAPMADVPASQVPAVIRRMDSRLSGEATPAEAGMLWTATYWLLGLRYSAEVAEQLLQGVRAMRESATYQAVLAEEARRFLLRLGTKRFGPPDGRSRAAVEALDDPERIEQLGDRLLEVTGWEELLQAD